MIICGSPHRDGKTNRLVRWVADAVREAGAEVEIADAAHLEYKANGCTACMACAQKKCGSSTAGMMDMPTASALRTSVGSRSSWMRGQPLAPYGPRGTSE